MSTQASDSGLVVLVHPDEVGGTTAVLGLGTGGVWTRRQALAVTTRGHVDHQLELGAWQVLWPGVHMDAGVVPDAAQRAHAAVLASGGAGQPFSTDDGRRALHAAASGRTAARVLGLPLIDDADPSTSSQEHLLDEVCVVSPGRTLRHRSYNGGVRVLRRKVRVLRPADLRRTRSGLWLTSPLRTLVDCASVLTREALTCAVDDALRRGLVSEQDLAQAVAERAWSPGVVTLRWAVEHADRRAESPGETLARLALLPSLPGLVPQHRLRDGAGRILARFDLGDEELRLAVEADGKAGHAGPEMAAKDRLRDGVAQSHGWRTERVTWWELRRARDAFVRRVAAAAEQARRSALDDGHRDIRR